MKGLKVALTKFGFIVTGDAFVQYQGTAKFSMKVVGATRPADGIPAAQEMVAEGVQLIELCGGFGPVWAGKIIEAIGMHRLFSE